MDRAAVTCPALMVAVPACGRGKTSVVAGLAWLHGAEANSELILIGGLMPDEACAEDCLPAPGAWAAEDTEAELVEKEPNWAPLLRIVAVATAGKTGAKWDFSPRVAADVVLPCRSLGPQRWAAEQGELRGHTFHPFSAGSPWVSEAQTQPGNACDHLETIDRQGALRPSYGQAWFASNPVAAAALFLPEVLA